MGALNDWDVTDANNNAAPPDGWPENTMAYSDVNDTGRAVQGTVKRFFDDINGSLVGAGAADAYTVTLNESYAAYFTGMIFRCSIVAENLTTTPTIDVNGIGASTIVNAGGGAVQAGDLETGGIYNFQYDGTNFRIGGGIGGGLFIEDVNGNIFGGSGAGSSLGAGANNFLTGSNAGTAITTGDDNIYIGRNAGLITDTESDNIAIGANALSASFLSDGNVAIGVNALRMFTGSASAGSNIAIGDSALGDAVGTLTAVGNIAIGDGAMSNANSLGNTTSTIAIGSNALNGLNGGGGNVAVGDSAGTGITTGISNVLIGRNAGQAITTGNNNIVIGPGGPTTAITGRLWIDFLASSDQPAIGGDLGGPNSGIEFGGTVFFFERAAALADQAGLGQVWVRNDTPNVFVFTDDAGTDFDLIGHVAGVLDLTALEMQIGEFNETEGTFTGAAGTKNLDVSTETVFSASSSMAGNAITFTFDNPPASGRAATITLILDAASTATITWPASVQWPGGTEPSWSTGTDVVSFVTVDNGTTWYGFLGGEDFS